MSENVREFTSANFAQDVLQSSEPVLVDFWAPWCGPCRMLGPTIEELAREYAGRVRVGKMNTDDAPDIAGQYDVSSIPTVIYFKNGQVVDRIVGLQPITKFRTMLG